MDHDLRFYHSVEFVVCGKSTHSMMIVMSHIYVEICEFKMGPLCICFLFLQAGKIFYFKKKQLDFRFIETIEFWRNRNWDHF